METELHRLARGRHGVLLTREAAALGYDGDFFRRLARAEGWHRLFRGAYLLPGHEPCLRVRVAAIQACWPDLVASHATAGVLWGLAGCQDRLELTGPKERRSAPAGCRYARDDLPPGDVVKLTGITMTTPERTVADLLLTSGRDDAVMALDSALHQRLTTLPAVAAALERRPDHDARLSRAWRAFRRADPAAESALETKARLLLEDAGLPVRTQVVMRVGGVDRRVDLLVGEAVLVELEGVAYHGGQEAHARDVRRFNELSLVSRRRPFLRLGHADVFRRWAITLPMIRRTVAAASSGGEPRGVP